jgi:hypothetical protein
MESGQSLRRSDFLLRDYTEFRLLEKETWISLERFATHSDKTLVTKKTPCITFAARRNQSARFKSMHKLMRYFLKIRINIILSYAQMFSTKCFLLSLQFYTLILSPLFALYVCPSTFPSFDQHNITLRRKQWSLLLTKLLYFLHLILQSTTKSSVPTIPWSIFPSQQLFESRFSVNPENLECFILSSKF